jgi:hypothetical protein
MVIACKDGLVECSPDFSLGMLTDASALLKSMFELVGDTSELALETIPKETMEIIVKYCQNDSDGLMDEVATADAGKSGHPLLCSLIGAASFLDMKSLLNLTTRQFALLIKDKTPEEIQRELGIQPDDTDADALKEFAWADVK